MIALEEQIQTEVCSCVQTKVTEETRLAVTVHHINEDASVVPRGAFINSTHGVVQINRSFGGESGFKLLSCANAKLLSRGK